MKQFIKKAGAKLAAGGSMLAAGTAAALAEVPADVQTALDGVKTDTLLAAGLVVGIAAGIFGLMLIKRVLR